jgi:hypothetical protein
MAIERMRDHKTPVEEQYVPDVCRLNIPLRSVVNLRRVAEELRGLAAELDRLSRSREPRAGRVLADAWYAVRQTSGILMTIRRPGRPSTSRSK